jgi:nitrite reductase/ring-hydroxylating ferredoxin subunit
MKLSFCNLSDLKKKKFITKWYEEFNDEICGIYISEQKIYFYSSICPHFGGDFKFLEENCQLRCNWHGWRFDVKSGESITDLNEYKYKSIYKNILKSSENQSIGCFPFKGKLKRYKHLIENDYIYIINNDNSRI